MDDLRLGEVGAELHRGALAEADLAALDAVAARHADAGAGARLFGEPALGMLLRPHASLGRIAASVLGPDARPVRALLFDKSEGCNWAVAWHQDRVIAVQERVEESGFGPWTTKGGVLHVQPPYELLAGMLTLRAHLDPCDEDNAALLVARGSHKLGRIAAEDAADVAGRAEVVCCTARRGDLWAYSTPVLHASEWARAPARRRVLQVDYAAEALPGGLEWAGV